MTYIISHYISGQRLSRTVIAQAGNGGGVVDDRRSNGRARLRHQFPERFPVETGEWKRDAAGLAQRDDPQPVEVEQLVKLNPKNWGASLIFLRNLYRTMCGSSEYG
jgi:hypothetical protein